MSENSGIPAASHFQKWFFILSSQKLGIKFAIPVQTFPFPKVGDAILHSCSCPSNVTIVTIVTIVILSNTKAGNKIGNEPLKFVHTKIDIMHLLEKSIKNSQCVLDDDKAGADAEEQG